MRIRIESLSKRYGRIEVLDGVTLDIAEGKIVATLGPNGACKATLQCFTDNFRESFPFMTPLS
jgi:ABC-type multidrug transport system ATPase subunit